VKLLLASHNQGKLKEMRKLLGSTVEVVLPQDVGVTTEFDVDETGATFQDNALLKAEAFAQRTGLLTLADDSGLAVTALNGAPGVKSKRLVPGSDHDRNVHLLKLLESTQDRSAYFITVLCLFDPQTKSAHFFEGRVNGTLAKAERGKHGFGYDPLFIPNGFDVTFAELGLEVKNTLSHRAKAARQVKEFLSSYVTSTVPPQP
jgi:XTP/dITP diphosphohydrolase